jgi:hypothetical protein
MRNVKRNICKSFILVLIMQLLMPLLGGDRFDLHASADTVTDSVYTNTYSGFGNANTITQSPTVPQNFVAASVYYNQVTLTWDPSTDDGIVTGYNLYRDGSLITTTTVDVYAAGSVSYTDRDLLPSTAYSYEVEAVDNDGNVSAKTPTVTVTTQAIPAVSGNGHGLKAEYFNGTDFNTLQLTRLDTTVDFNWGNSSPAAGVDPQSFSVRWSGKLTPRYSESYTLYTVTHGGVRLWIDGQPVIDRWSANGHTEASGTISLQAGHTYQIEMDYTNDNGVAEAQLLWSSDSQAKEIIPQTQLDPPFIPAIPGNIAVSATSETITVTWDSVEGASGYDVEADGVVMDNGLSTSFMQTVTPNSSHTYRVRAKAPEIAGDWSSLVQASSHVATPQNVQVSLVDGGLKLQWDAVAGADGYEVEADGQLIDNGSGLEYIHSGLMPDTEHTYRVRAKSSGGDSDWSSLLTKMFLSTVPANVTAVSTARSITVSWDPVDQAVGYEIEADGVVTSVGMNTSFVHSNLEPNTRHAYRVRALNADGPLGWSVLIQKSTLSETGRGTGLKGTYFDGEDLTTETYSRIDGTVNFDWKNNMPAPGIQDGNYSVRWTGQVEPSFTETYTFYTDAHGGTRLWVNGQLIIDNWQAHNRTVQQGSITLEAGKRYDIKLEYSETNGVGAVQLLWESPSQAKDVIPQNQLYPVGVPANPAADASETSIALRWDAVSFADDYQVERDGAIVADTSDAQYTDVNLAPGTMHTYRIRAKSGIAIGEWSESLSVHTLLGIPTVTDLTATETTIAVQWQEVAGAEDYDIEVDGTIVNNDANTNYMHSDLLSGTEHGFRVRAKTAAVTGEWSTLVQKWTLPDIPANIRTGSTSTSVSIDWDSVRGATGYEIFAFNTTVDNGASTHYVDSGLDPNTQYTYKIRAKNSSGNGKWSAIVAKSTLPAVPANLHGTATDVSVAVEWDAVSGAVGYDLEVDGVVQSGLTSPDYDHTGLLPSSNHTYRVRAVGAEGSSEWSEPVVVTTLPGVPGNVKAVATSVTVALSWDEATGATGYEVEADGVPIQVGSSVNYVHSGLTSGTEHSYRVRAVNQQIAGEWSPLLTVTTLPAVPANPKATVGGSTQITLTWDPVVGATKYEVEADGASLEPGLSTSYVHSGLQPLSNHSYRVRAWNAGGAGEWTAAAEATTSLGQPQNIQTAADMSSIRLTWDQMPGATGYDVLADGVLTDVGTAASFTHSGLAPFSSHLYRVRAKAAEIMGDWSETVIANTALGIPKITEVQPSAYDIQIAWNEVIGATGYELEADGSTIDVGNVTTYTHSNLAPNTQHSYRVRAKNGTAYSDWSTWSSQITLNTTPAIPGNLHGDATPNSVKLQWDSVVGAISYDLEIDGQIVSDISSTDYTHSRLDPNTMHEYRVRANGAGGRSDWSSKLSKITTPEMTVDVGKDTMFNFVTVVPKKAGITERKITVTYNPDELEVLDLSAITPEKELAPGPIAGTNMAVVQFTPGTIVYSVQNTDKTVVNSIRFQAKTSDYSKITYSIE